MKAIDKGTALDYLKAGLAVLPASKAGKRPVGVKWSAYINNPPSDIEVDFWFNDQHDAICIVTGKVSNNLECIDFDNKAELYGAWKDKVDQNILNQCVIERSQSGGIHVYYRCETPIEGNLKLAYGTRNGTEKTLIETRGQGGIIICAPTEGYEPIQGTLTALPVISAEARNRLLAAARELNERSDATKPETDSADPARSCPKAGFDKRPGTDFNQRGDIRPYLLAHRWQQCGTASNDNELWTRPGKDPKDGNSATLKNNRFQVFSTNVKDLKPGNYSIFEVYTRLEHGGDYTAAAKKLFSMGFGKPSSTAAGTSTTARRHSDDNATEPDDKTVMLPADPGPLPEDLLQVPGFISDYSAYILRMAHHPNKVAAFAGALSMLSHLSGRRYKCSDGTRMNLYIVALGNSGVGKECPRSCNIRLATTLQFLTEIGDTFASGEGLEDSLLTSPAMLYQVDEVDYLFNTVRQKDARAEQLNAMVLKLYSESSTVHKRRAKALTEKENSNAAAIIEPHFVFFGTATPRFFYQAMSERSMENGLMARCLILELGSRGDINLVNDEPLPESVLDHVRRIRAGVGNGNLSALAATLPQHPPLRIITIGLEAKDRLLEAHQCYDKLYLDAESASMYASMALWARAGEKVTKLSALYALSKDPDSPIISSDAVLWAKRLVDHLTQRTLFMSSIYVFDGEFDEKIKKLTRILNDNKGQMGRSRLLRNSHFDRDTFDKIVGTMMETGALKSLTSAKGGEVFELIK